jgi:hypothetical protein
VVGGDTFVGIQSAHKNIKKRISVLLRDHCLTRTHSQTNEKRKKKTKKKQEKPLRIASTCLCF